MSKQFVCRSLLILTLICLFSLISLPVSARSLQNRQGAARQQSCHTLEATLHGAGQPIFSCLDRQIAALSSVTPNINAHTCGTDVNDLAIYQNGPIQAPNQIPPGPVLCIRGQGLLNLPTVPLDATHSWDNQASAWWAGCSSGLFFDNINGSANNSKFETASFSGGNGINAPSGNFPYQSGLGFIPNDALSSIFLGSNC